MRPSVSHFFRTTPTPSPAHHDAVSQTLTTERQTPEVMHSKHDAPPHDPWNANATLPRLALGPSEAPRAPGLVPAFLSVVTCEHAKKKKKNETNGNAVLRGRAAWVGEWVGALVRGEREASAHTNSQNKKQKKKQKKLNKTTKGKQQKCSRPTVVAGEKHSGIVFHSELLEQRQNLTDAVVHLLDVVSEAAPARHVGERRR